MANANEFFSPFFNATTAAVAVDTVLAVKTDMPGGRGLRKVTVTPSQLPDGGKTHKLAINQTSPARDFTGADAMTFTIEHGTTRSDEPFECHRLHLTSGKNGTTFLIVGNV